MNNREIQAAWKYHDGTKHSYWSVRNRSHLLDWANRPLPFKIYPKIEPLPLPRDVPQTGVAVFSAISEPVPSSPADSVPGVQDLTRLLYFSAGITKRRAYPGGEIYFRAAACTGALYHIDLYLVCGDLPGLPAGVYHFGPHDFALRRLRAGDYRGVLAQASGQEPAVKHAPATVVCTSTYWRNAWKYQARTYRHCFWDAGTLLANLLAATTALEVPAQVVAGFVDSEVNRLLDLDTKREVALALVPLGSAAEPAPGPLPAIEPLNLTTVPLSKSEVDYPAIHAMHAASSLTRANEVSAWRGGTPHRTDPAPAGRLFPLAPLSDAELPEAPLDTVIRQ